MQDGPPPRPGANKLPEPTITRPRPRLKSHDDASAVRAEEAANVREGQLLAELATKQQQLAAAEQLAQRLQAEAQARAQAEARSKAAVIIEQPQGPVSVAPPGEAFRAREVRIGDLKGWAALLAGFSSLVVAGIGALKPEPPPKVLDNAATVSALQAELSRQSREMVELKKALSAGEGWTGAAFEAIGVDVTRAEGAPALPALAKTPLTTKATKPFLRIDTPQPAIRPPPEVP